MKELKRLVSNDLKKIEKELREMSYGELKKANRDLTKLQNLVSEAQADRILEDAP